MGRFKSKLLACSLAMIAAQIFTAQSNAKDAFQEDKKQWHDICLSRLPAYNRVRLRGGFEKWSKKDAEIHCMGSWALYKTNKEREADVMNVAKSGCFITSACCEALGLEDNCFELKTLRAFRDNFLMRTVEGRGDVALYYELAPAIAEELQKDPSRMDLVDVYYRYIVPCVVLAKIGMNNRAHRLYGEMMGQLVMRYAHIHCA